MFEKVFPQAIVCAALLPSIGIGSCCLAESDLGNQYLYVEVHETDISSGDLHVERVVMRNTRDGSHVFEFITTDVSSQSTARWEVFATTLADGFSFEVYAGEHWRYTLSLDGEGTNQPVFTIATPNAIASMSALEDPSQNPAFAQLADSTSADRALVTAVFESVADEYQQQVSDVSESCTADCYDENPPWPLPGVNCADPGSPNYSGYFCCKRNADVALCISLNCLCPGTGQPEYCAGEARNAWFTLVGICTDIHLEG